MTKNAGQFQKTSSGLLSNKIYYRLKGRQKERAYQPAIQNPRTDSQMLVRVALQNVTVFYRILSANFPIYFQGKKNRQSINNKFVSLNKNIHPIYQSKEDVQSNICEIEKYIVSQGQLQPFGKLTNIYQESTMQIYWGAMLSPEGYTGSNMPSLIRAMKNTFKDFSPGEILHIAFIGGPIVNVQSEYTRISMQDKELPSNIQLREDGFLYIIKPLKEYISSGLIFMRSSLDKHGHVLVSSQSVNISSLKRVPVYNRSSLEYADIAIKSYQI